MFHLLLGALLLGALNDVQVKTLDGQSIAGELAEADLERLVIVGDSGRTEIRTDRLLTLRRAEPADEHKQEELPIRIGLVDGSLLAASSFEVSAGSASVGLDRSAEGGTTAKQSLPTSMIRYVWFAASVPKNLEGQWTQILATTTAADLLVVRRKASLDYLEGVLGDISGDRVSFKEATEQLSVKRGRVVGLVYYHKSTDKLGEPVCTLADASGSRTAVKKFVLKADVLRIETPAGLELDVPLAEVVAIDFSRGKIVYLSDLEPQSTEYTPYLSLGHDGDSLAAFYRPRRNAGFGDEGLSLGGQRYAKGLRLLSRSKMIYKLEGKYRRLEALVGIDDRIDAGNAKVELVGDDRSLWQAEILGSHAPKPVDVDVTGVKRLVISVDYGRGWDVADYVNLCDIRVTK